MLRKDKNIEALFQKIETQNHFSLIIILIIVLYALFIVYPSFKCGYLVEGDTAFHFLASAHFAKTDLPSGNIFGWIDIFGGLPFFKYYPPLFYYFFGILNTLTLNLIEINYLWTFYLFFVVLLTSLSTYYLMRALKFSKLESLFASLFMISWRQGFLDDFSPNIIYGIGIVPFAFSIIFFNFYLAFFFKSLEDKKFSSLAMASVCLALLFLSHFHSFFVGVFFSAIYLAYYLIRRKENLLPLFKRMAILSVSSLLLLSFWLIPSLMTYDYGVHADNIMENKWTYIESFLTNEKNALDSHIPFLFSFGFVGIFLAIFGKKNKESRIFILLLLVSAILITVGITNYLKLPFSNLLSYNHAYGREMAFFKLSWILLAVTGIYEFFSLLIKKPSRFYSVLILVLLIVLADQILLKYQRGNDQFSCFDKELFSDGFRNPSIFISDVKTISEALKSFPDNSRVFIDPRASNPQTMMIPYLTKRGVETSWDAAFVFMRLRQSNYALYDIFSSGDFESFVRMLKALNVRYLVIDTKSEELEKQSPKIEKLPEIKNEKTVPTVLTAKSIYKSMAESKEFRQIYKNRLLLLELKGEYSLVEIKSNAIAIVDDELYWKDLNEWRNYVKTSLKDDRNAWVLSTSEEIPENRNIKTFLLGKVNCNSPNVKKLLSRLDIEIVKIKGRNSCNFEDKKIASIGKEDFYLKGIHYDFYNESIVQFYDGNTLHFIAYSERKEVPMLIKNNFYPNWEIVQDEKELKKYFVLPQQILIFVEPYKDVKVTFGSQPYEKIGFAISILTVAAIVALIVRHRPRHL